MPRWGLTADMMLARPWGLDPTSPWLEPRKIVTDPIHGDLYLNGLEIRLVDSEPFQRLRRIRQLGNTHLVYPGATHSRFAHALGTLRVAQDLMDAVVDQRSGPHPAPDLFVEWAEEGDLSRRIAEATMLARVGALLHDFCHVPFGHSLEDDLGLLTAHDKNTTRFERLWSEITPEVLEVLRRATSIEGNTLENDLRPLILAKEEDSSGNPIAGEISYPFVMDIVGNTICADLIDYLQRDHRFTGLPAQLGHRFIHGFFVTSRHRETFPQRVALKIRRPDGAERRDAISELLKYLRYRYELSERALEHHTKLAADAMVGKALEIWYDSLWLDLARQADPKLKFDDTADAADVRAAFEEVQGEAAAEAIADEVLDKIEDEVVARGDDGFLETLLRLAEAKPSDSRMRAVRRLVSGILNRNLYKPAARHSGKKHAARIHKAWGDLDDRRALEKNLATFAEIKSGWSVILWVPPETMRLKPAEVLVYDGEEVMPLVSYESARLDRGRDIYQAHENLWSVNVFVNPSVPEEVREVIVARAAEKLGTGSWDHPETPTSSWRLAARRVAQRHHLSADEERALEKDVLAATRPILKDWTFSDVFGEVEQRARDLGMIASAEQSAPDLRTMVHDLLVSSGALTAPVPLEQIAETLGIEVRQDETMPRDQDGRLVDMLPPDSETRMPVIYLNADKPATRKRFTLAHEIGHVHIDRVPEYASAARDSKSGGARERLMNAFAGELLMPTALLDEYVREHGDNVAGVARRFGVSQAAARQRLRDRGKTAS